MTKSADHFSVTCNAVVIGHSAFEQRGLPRSIIGGAFKPAKGYELVRHLFRADTVAHVRPSDPDGETVLRAFYKTKDRLEFGVDDPDGKPVSIEYLHVYDPVAADGAHAVVARLSARGSRARKKAKWFTSRSDA